MNIRWKARIGGEAEAWVRFIGAVLALALAFGAALFSTVTRDAGNVIATAVLASMALLLAGWVALTTVPYLARRVAIARVREALDYEVTREGLVYMGMVLLIGVAALNTGNNLLFIVVSAMLAAIVVSGIASAAMLQRVETEITLPEHVFANDNVTGRIGVVNLSRWWPAFSISVVPPKGKRAKSRWKLQKSLFRWPPKAKPEKLWISLPDVQLTRTVLPAVRSEILKDAVYFPYIPTKATAGAEVELKFPARGKYVQEGFGLQTRFPFSFLVKTRRMRLNREIIVYPPVAPTDEFFEVLPMITGEFESFVAGRGYDLYRIREYLPEDSARHVDWKATAKTGALKVREFTKEDERKLRIVFDNPAPGEVSAESYERYVALAASLCWHFSGGNTELSFSADAAMQEPGIFGFLRYLALVEPRKSEPLLESLPLSDDYNVIFTARARGSIPTSLWNCSYFIFFE